MWKPVSVGSRLGDSSCCTGDGIVKRAVIARHPSGWRGMDGGEGPFSVGEAVVHRALIGDMFLCVCYSKPVGLQAE